MDNKPKTQLGKPVKKGYFETLVDDGVDKFAAKWFEEDLKPSIKGIGYSICLSIVNGFHGALISGVNKLFDVKSTTATGYTNYNLVSGSSPYKIANNIAPISNAVTNGVTNLFSGSGKQRIDPRCPIGEIIFLNRQDADFVLYNMIQTLNQYGVVGLDRFYELANYDIQAGEDYNISNLGWRDLTNATVVKNGNGWSLQLPLYRVVR